MAYLQATANSIDDILNTIATFASGLGWAIERNNTYTSGSNNNRILTLSRPGVDYAHLATDYNTTPAGSKTNIHTMRSIGVALTDQIANQPDKSHYGSTNLLSAGPYVNLWLFGENGANPYVHCVVEHAAGRFRHFGFGELIKAGTWTGGSYCTGTNWSTHPNTADVPDTGGNLSAFSSNISTGTDETGSIRCDDCDAAPNGTVGIDNRYLPYSSGASISRRVMTGHRGVGNGDFLYARAGMGDPDFSFSQYNQRSHLIRLAHFVTGAGGYFRYIGEPPAVRVTTMNPYQNGEEFTIGSDTWKIFPVVRKGIVTDEESSGSYALVYKKVV